MEKEILNNIHWRGSMYFDQLLDVTKLSGAKLYEILSGLIAAGAIEEHRSVGGLKSYRIPFDRIEKVRNAPVKLEMIGETKDLDYHAERLFIFTISKMSGEFTVSQVQKAQVKTKFVSNKVRNCLIYLESIGKIRATQSKTYMGKSFNLFEVSSLAEDDPAAPPKPKRLVRRLRTRDEPSDVDEFGDGSE